MKRTRRLAIVLIPALVVTILLAWWFWQRSSAGSAPAEATDTAAIDPAVADAGISNTAGRARSTGEDNDPISPGAESANQTPELAQSIGRPAGLSSLAETGPRPMSPEGQARIDAVLPRLDGLDKDGQDYALLARAEAPDPDWSPRLEQSLQLALDQHGRGFTGLEVSRPRCARTVCVITAAARVLETQHPNADWQQLTFRIAKEPWFKDAFFDTRTSVTSDKQGALYVTYFIRK
ncbi:MULTISPECIES: hypothetical protein [unclassified Pseudoxanthomonas]|uniref:hypothetical protein n=1 Tax=unclassified Pseudoxanthomonas TaxID=2645906 RepID=UPI0030769004